MKRTKILLASMATLVLASCGTHKAIVRQQPVLKTTPSETPRASVDSTKYKLAFVQNIADLALYQKNVVSNLSFTINNGRKDITVPGILHMRKDEVIRLQLLIPLLRSEVGRIEFTKDYVLFIDRIHKQYVKASYDEVGFLRDNGINFYTLQALFWNQLFIPRPQKVDGSAHIRLKDGKMSYDWVIPAEYRYIYNTLITYKSSTHGTSELSWLYRDFKPFGSKMFPATHSVTIETPAIGSRPAKELSATFELNDFSDASDWEAFTQPSDKYTKVSVEEILGKLMNF